MGRGTVDLAKTVLELCEEHEDFKDTMHVIGFEQITKPGMLQSMGRIMTIPKGCRAKGRDLGDVIRQLEEMGYDVVETPKTGGEQR
ncbi:DUF1858 domain-containing protein [Salisediminibacterium selenitireducens]|uniref:DUF1858 domain-containing protein n=1 Tax=Bacillus selenitireducens (strain ATCC 700615 / DSM 15326 / MLS10) TaxID=439292 RepID=D6XYM1_BACIE|nr:DUF1858 domain-containing protein [Salisediminibacterium selenitireducens]ADH98179.1 Domain of unknown function DUF1858 [[Bacillus] selenitireducens MLS10]